MTLLARVAKGWSLAGVVWIDGGRDSAHLGDTEGLLPAPQILAWPGKPHPDVSPRGCPSCWQTPDGFYRPRVEGTMS